MAVTLFVMGLLLPSLAAASTLHSEKSDSKVVRREGKVQDKLQLGAGGQMVSRPTARTQELCNLCDCMYVDGNEGDNHCGEPATQKMIDDAYICETAARATCADKANGGASCVGSPGLEFTIESEYYNHYPDGCYKGEDGKFFFNPRPYDATADGADRAQRVIQAFEDARGTPKSTPVCLQVRYINGTKDKSECKAEDAAEYEQITSEDECRFYAGCMSRCPEPVFSAVTEKEMQDAPAGCHINEADGCVRFNSRLKADNKPVTPAATLTGIPVCMLKAADPKEAAEVAAHAKSASAAASATGIVASVTNAGGAAAGSVWGAVKGAFGGAS